VQAPHHLIFPQIGGMIDLKELNPTIITTEYEIDM